MKAQFVTKKLKSYPGDTTTMLSWRDNDGRTFGISGLTPRNDRMGRYYENDNNGEVFKTVRAAKLYYAKNRKQFVGKTY